MSNANKITVIRIIISILMVILLIFPFYQMGVNVPTYLYNNIMVDIRYLLSGVLLIIVSILDYFDNYIGKKEKTINIFSNMFDELAALLLINSLLIILAVNGMISPIIAIVIVVRDILVDRMKFIVTCYNRSYRSTLEMSLKIVLIVGLIMTLFYNIPFALLGLDISDFLLILATVLSVISGIRYYLVTKDLLLNRKSST